MHLLLAIDGGEMQKRVCGANAVASVESMILCEVADEAQVGGCCEKAHLSQHSPKVRPAGLIECDITFSRWLDQWLAFKNMTFYFMHNRSGRTGCPASGHDDASRFIIDWRPGDCCCGARSCRARREYLRVWWRVL